MSNAFLWKTGERVVLYTVLHLSITGIWGMKQRECWNWKSRDKHDLNMSSRCKQCYTSCFLQIVLARTKCRKGNSSYPIPRVAFYIYVTDINIHELWGWRSNVVFILKSEEIMRDKYEADFLRPQRQVEVRSLDIIYKIFVMQTGDSTSIDMVSFNLSSIRSPRRQENYTAVNRKVAHFSGFLQLPNFNILIFYFFYLKDKCRSVRSKVRQHFCKPFRSTDVQNVRSHFKPHTQGYTSHTHEGPSSIWTTPAS